MPDRDDEQLMLLNISESHHLSKRWLMMDQRIILIGNSKIKRESVTERETDYTCTLQCKKQFPKVGC